MADEAVAVWLGAGTQKSPAPNTSTLRPSGSVMRNPPNMTAIGPGGVTTSPPTATASAVSSIRSAMSAGRTPAKAFISDKNRNIACCISLRG